MTNRRPFRRAIALLAALFFSGCVGERAYPTLGSVGEPTDEAAAAAETIPAAVPTGPEPVTATFDQAEAEALLVRAREADRAGDLAEAQRLYREAALLWPDDAAAWQGLAEVSAALDDTVEQQAAMFMVERVSLYSSDDLFVQREVNRALRDHIARRRGEPDADPVRLAYAERLADFYSDLYAERGVYEPPLPVGNIAWRELPAVLLVGGGLITYAVIVISGSTEQE
jgi:hypothetical protein